MEEELREQEDSESKKSKHNLIINIVLLSIIIILIVVLLLNKFVLTTMRVNGESMVPTLKEKQLVLVHHTKKVAKDDIIVFTKDDRYIVKRVVGVVGDKVIVLPTGEVYVNGKYNRKLNGTCGDNFNAWNVTIKDGELFVLGDNLSNSADSADYGPISLDQVMGKLI